MALVVNDMSGDSDEHDAARWDAVEEATEYLVAGEHERVLELLRDVLEKDPKNAYAYHYLGAAFFELETYDAAADAYRAALSFRPNYLGARVALVHALRLSNEADAATSEAREALRRFPDDADALFALGLGLAARGERQEAVRALKRFLGTNPEVEVQLDTQGIIDLLNQEPDGEPLIWK